jgi:hypothetical protein
MARSPITWRNVAAPDFSGAADMMGQAQESFTGALDTVRETKDTFEKGRTDRNTQDFLGQLQQYGTSEELAAAQQSGDVADLRGQFGNLINQDKTSVDAVTGRVGTLQGQEDAAFNREEMLTGREDKRIADPLNRRINDIDLGLSGKALAKVRTTEESAINESGASDAVKSRLLNNLETKLVASQGKGRADEGYAVKQENQANTRADRKVMLAERNKEISRENAYESITADLDEMGSEWGSASEARAGTTNFITTDPRGALLSPTQRRDLTANAAPSYSQRFGLLPGQLAVVEDAQGRADEAFDVEAAKLAANTAELERATKTPEYMAWTSENRTTESDAIKQAVDMTDDVNIAEKMGDAKEFISGLVDGSVKASAPRRTGRSNVLEADNGSVAFTDQLSKLDENNPSVNGIEVPWGLIGQRAVNSSVTNEWFSDEDKDLDVTALKRGYQREYLNWLNAEARQRELFKAKEGSAARLVELRKMSKDSVTNVRDNLMKLNKQLLKGKK